MAVDVRFGLEGRLHLSFACAFDNSASVSMAFIAAATATAIALLSLVSLSLLISALGLSEGAWRA